MEQCNKFIIGAGITGLIYGFYHPEYIVLGEEIGGQIANGSIGPMYLHKDKFTTQFLLDLAIDRDWETHI